jgi:hypothetical protein
VVFTPNVSVQGQFVVQSAVGRQEGFNPEYLTAQRLDADPDGWLQFAKALGVVVQKLATHKAL